jgi:hypothetical protein
MELHYIAAMIQHQNLYLVRIYVLVYFFCIFNCIEMQLPNIFSEVAHIILTIQVAPYDSM